MKTLALLTLLLAPQGSPQTSDTASFEDASAAMAAKLEASLAELAALRDEMAESQIPLNEQLRDLQAELAEVDAEYREVNDLLSQRAFDLTGLINDRKKLENQNSDISGIFEDYIRKWEPRLHIAELQRYRDRLEATRDIALNDNLNQNEKFDVQLGILELSLDRLEEAVGGATFEGTAVDPDGVIREGKFALFGPSALFASTEDDQAGSAEQPIGLLEPALVTFDDPLLTAASAEVALTGAGTFPFDPTLGNAHKIAQTEDTFLEHVQKGGEVMYPILGMAALSLLLALVKWIQLSFTRKPSKKKVNELLEAVSRHDEEAAREISKKMRGPTGEMLHAGVAHMTEPKDLVEEVMYERVMTAKLSLNRFLPFIAICAASAPLMGLLGTVTGIINTFKLITVFGSGDVKMLSGGISEALITTKFGLIVAIPSLLLHAFLSRKARGISGQMETSAVSFVNQLGKTPFEMTNGVNQGHSDHRVQVPQAAGRLAGDGELRDQIREVLSEMLVPQVASGNGNGNGHGAANGNGGTDS